MMKCERDQIARHVVLEHQLTEALVFHQVALILSAVFMCLSISISFWLILDHALHYLKPYEQKQILAMTPIYVIISFFSLLFHQKDIYLELLRNCYEVYVIASAFTLMCHYIAPNVSEQREYFRHLIPKPWGFPLKWLQTPRSGLKWFNIIYVSIFQSCITRPLCTIVAGIVETQNLYCHTSMRPEFGHLWIALFQGICIMVTMYCFMQFYMQLKANLAAHHAFSQIACTKFIVFLCFWQTWCLGLIHPNAFLAALDIRIGIPCILLCFEMTLLAALHHKAFTWASYDFERQLSDFKTPDRYACGPNEALLDVLNPWDYAKATARGIRWLLHSETWSDDNTVYPIRLRELKINPRPRVGFTTTGRKANKTDPAPLSSIDKQPERLERTIG